MIEDTFHYLRPKWEFAPDLESAYRKFNDMRIQNFKVDEIEFVEAEEKEDENSSIDGDVDDLAAGEDSQSSDVEIEDDVSAVRQLCTISLTDIDERRKQGKFGF